LRSKAEYFKPLLVKDKEGSERSKIILSFFIKLSDGFTRDKVPDCGVVSNPIVSGIILVA